MFANSASVQNNGSTTFNLSENTPKKQHYGAETVTCYKVGTGINYGSHTGSRYKIMDLITFIQKFVEICKPCKTAYYVKGKKKFQKIFLPVTAFKVPVLKKILACLPVLRIPIWNRFPPDLGSQTHIFDSLLTYLWLKIRI